ncbi:MAG: hypothetical protein HZC02_04160 [Candidatus Levybacteria bacterium]|nr:hypothetical protein [Candidatus Levybacteria bacterium]
MPTLHDSTELTKNIAKWGGLAIAGIFLIIILIRGGIFLFTKLFPKPAPPPLVAFGKLPQILFPESIDQEKFNYQLETITGGLGTFSDRANVYKTAQKEPNLLDLAQVREAALNTTFNSGEIPVTSTEYSFLDTQRPDKKLNVNIVSRDFNVQSNYFSYEDLEPENFVDQEKISETAINFLTNFGLYPLDIDENKTTIQLLSIQGSSLFAATSVSTAQLARIDFQQKNLNKIPIVYPHPPQSTMHLLIGGKDNDEILEGVFFHQSISDTVTTYPLLDVQKAYQLLKDHKAYVGSYFGTNTNIIIKSVSLGYFIGEQKQEYVMPVYVFEGKDGFFAYVSAVNPQWINQ